MALIEFTRQLNERRRQKDGLLVVAADGKTLRGTRENDEQLHVLHLFAHNSALALDQVAVGHTAGEIGGTKDWEQVAEQFPGLQVLTGDARLADRDLCQAIVDSYKDYVFRLKNQPSLYADAEVLFSEPGPAQSIRVEKGHGRLERREIRASSELAEYSSFPGLMQLAEVKKRVVFLKTGEIKESREFFISSLGLERALPDRLLAFMRGRWGIENGLFHVKDDSFGEDRHVLASHRGGEVMSLLRATATNLLRGRSALWHAEPLTVRAQCVCAKPLAALTPTAGCRILKRPKRQRPRS